MQKAPHLKAEPAFCGYSIFGAAGDQAQPGRLGLEGLQSLPTQQPAHGTLSPSACCTALPVCAALPSNAHIAFLSAWHIMQCVYEVISYIV